MMTPEETVSSAERREIESACSRLVQSFAYLVDHRRYDELTVLFTDDGVFERPGARTNGRAELRSFLVARPRGTVTRHVIGAPYFLSVSLDSAASVTYLTMYQGEGNDDEVVGFAGPSAIAEVHSVFRRVDGQWKIASHVNQLVMSRR